MGVDAFTAAESRRLLALLDRLRSAGGSIPNMPEPIFRALRGIVALAAVELVITESGADVLLTRRDDGDWRGWHLPGGFVAPNESMSDACNRIARRELGIAVTLTRILTAEGWRDHPYASVVSIACECRPLDRPGDGRFFRNMPDDLLLQHRPFVASFFAASRVGGSLKSQPGAAPA